MNAWLIGSAIVGIAAIGGAIYCIATIGRRERTQVREDCPCSDWDYRK